MSLFCTTHFPIFTSLTWRTSNSIFLSLNCHITHCVRDLAHRNSIAVTSAIANNVHCGYHCIIWDWQQVCRITNCFYQDTRRNMEMKRAEKGIYNRNEQECTSSYDHTATVAIGSACFISNEILWLQISFFSWVPSIVVQTTQIISAEAFSPFPLHIAGIWCSVVRFKCLATWILWIWGDE